MISMKKITRRNLVCLLFLEAWRGVAPSLNDWPMKWTESAKYVWQLNEYNSSKQHIVLLTPDNSIYIYI